MKPTVFAELQHWYEATLQSLEGGSIPSKSQKSKLVHVYDTVFHGFSAKLTTQQAQQLEERPGVVFVFPDRLLKLHTTWSPHFLGLYDDTNYIVARPLLNESHYGKNVTIGFLDSGINPNHASFNDSGIDPLPAGRWKGECEKPINCTNKLVGFRIITTGTDVGHGTHVASTAAGRAVTNVFYSENASGTAVGVAPKARIASYKVCDVGGCSMSDVILGFEKAVKDGVDIITVPFEFPDSEYQQNPIVIGAFAAMDRGISVIASAGNSGPFERTVLNVAPWVTTVGAGTMDRRFAADLVANNGFEKFQGASLYSGPPLDPASLPLAYGGDCMSLDQSFSGKIVVCNWMVNHTDVDEPVLIDELVRKVGGAGVVAANIYPAGRDLIAKHFTIPGLVIYESDGNLLRQMINASMINGTMINATMIFQGVEFGTDQLPAPAVAFFSSRGPNNISPYVMKPDVLAPGVNILAAWPEGVEFKLLSGTSMACAHVSGLTALLKGAHPDWSPAMIRSAIMTTAYTTANDGNPIINNDDVTNSTTLDMGAGHIHPGNALDPGLVYDISPQDYVNFMCASNYTDVVIKKITSDKYGSENCNDTNTMPWDLNYPAISIDSQSLDLNRDFITVTRTVTNVGEDVSTYTVNVTNPKGVILIVTPKKMDFTSKGEKKNYYVAVIVNTTKWPGDISVEGKIVWSDGERQVVLPVVIAITGN
ncbi:Subtilase family protein [Striga hermonthica]|uniref:Subtilase family protein n=1 Tax=Striga hermonthica TaxID=68872 RepID=A0A9N7NA95_STRHE|nr:Subtilase family protein [Striga hermonthica]